MSRNENVSPVWSDPSFWSEVLRIGLTSTYGMLHTPTLVEIIERKQYLTLWVAIK